MSTHLLLRFARRSVACTRFFRPLSTFGGLVSRSVVARPQFVVPFHLKATSSSSRNTARFSSKSAISSTRPRRRYRAAAWSTSSIRRISATSPIGRNGSTVEKPIRKFSARFSINTFPRAWIYIYIYIYDRRGNRRRSRRGTTQDDRPVDESQHDDAVVVYARRSPAERGTTRTRSVFHSSALLVARRWASRRRTRQVRCADFEDATATHAMNGVSQRSMTGLPMISRRSFVFE